MPRGCLLWLVCLLAVLLALPAGGTDDPLEKAKTLIQKAVEQYQAGRYQEALPLPQRALEINEKVLNVSEITSPDSHSRFEIPPERPGDTCPRKRACLKALVFKIVT